MSALKSVKDVRKAVAAIRKDAGDDESQHAAEDNLHANVLAAIANGSAEDPKAMAREALETLNIKFSRWCA